MVVIVAWYSIACGYKVDCIIQANSKHEHIDLIPAEVANVGVRVACAEGISNLCQEC